MENREQQRMAQTWSTLTGRFDQDPSAWSDNDVAKGYLRHLKSTRARIHTCGVGQALAFLKSRRNDNSAKAAVEDIGQLARSLVGLPGAPPDIFACLRAASTGEWALYTEESAQVVAWLCRYLEGAGVTPGGDV